MAVDERAHFLAKCHALIGPEAAQQSTATSDGGHSKDSTYLFCKTCSKQTPHSSTDAYLKTQLAKLNKSKNTSKFSQNRTKIISKLINSFELFKCLYCKENNKKYLNKMEPFPQNFSKHTSASKKIKSTVHSKRKSVLKTAKELNKLLESDNFDSLCSFLA